MMRYWWVNQKRTYRQEVPGGYLWSPKRKRNDRRNPYYEFMREVAPGDAVFSYANRLIGAIGIAASYCYECPKPAEFGNRGANWSNIGWRVDVAFRELLKPLRPADHMRVLGPLLPSKYSPLYENGHGNQSMYLTRLDEPLARALLMLLGREAQQMLEGMHVRESREYGSTALTDSQLQWEEHLVRQIQGRPLPDTEKEALVLARRGQGMFKERVRRLEPRCRVTHVDRIEHLRASHCKPWRDSNDEERLDGNNGLLLTPTIDHLFDRGFISFENSGELLVSPVAHSPSLERMGVPIRRRLNVGQFSDDQKTYLEFHRDRVFLSAQVG